MGMIPPGKTPEEIERDAISLWKARRNSGKPTYPAEKVHDMLIELQSRFEAAGQADPKIVEELLSKIRLEASA